MKYSLPLSILLLTTVTACGGDERTSDQGPEATDPQAESPLGAVPVPVGNPLTEAKVALGAGSPQPSAPPTAS